MWMSNQRNSNSQSYFHISQLAGSLRPTYGTFYSSGQTLILAGGFSHFKQEWLIERFWLRLDDMHKQLLLKQMTT